MEIYPIAKNKKKEKHVVRNVFAPVDPRMIVSGPTKCGKTYMVASLIVHHLVFSRLYIYSKHLLDEKDVYVDLINHFTKIENKLKKKYKDPEFQMLFYGDKYDDIPDVTEFDPHHQNLVLIDDFMNEKDQSKVCDLYTSGRHKGIMTIYLTQKYSFVPSVIRDNANYFVFFEVPNNKEIRNIALEHCTDVDYHELKEIFRDAVSEKYSFMVIDRTADDFCLRYRKKWDGLIFKENDEE